MAYMRGLGDISDIWGGDTGGDGYVSPPPDIASEPPTLPDVPPPDIPLPDVPMPPPVVIGDTTGMSASDITKLIAAGASAYTAARGGVAQQGYRTPMPNPFGSGVVAGGLRPPVTYQTPSYTLPGVSFGGVHLSPMMLGVAALALILLTRK